MAACWSSPVLASLETEPQRVRRRDLAAAARRSRPQPHHHHQSTCGEPNRTPGPHVDLTQPCLAAGEPPFAGKGTVVNCKDMVVNPGTWLQ
jgi:hypothetical protein